MSRVLTKPLMESTPTTGALKQVLDTCTTPQDEFELVGAQIRLAQIECELHDALDFEADLREGLVSRANTLRAQIARHQLSLPRLSDEVFGWRNPQGLPILVPFQPTEPSVNITHAGSGMSSEVWVSGIPFRLVTCYQDLKSLVKPKWVLTREMDKAWYGSDRLFAGMVCVVVGVLFSIILTLLGSLVAYLIGQTISPEVWLGIVFLPPVIGAGIVLLPWQPARHFQSYTARYTGAVPPQIRALIREQRTNFADIAILSEVTHWDVQTRTAVPQIDPLVIGYHESAKGWYLLAAYETTDLEKLVKQEYTS